MRNKPRIGTTASLLILLCISIAIAILVCQNRQTKGSVKLSEREPARDGSLNVTRNSEAKRIHRFRSAVSTMNKIQKNRVNGEVPEEDEATPLDDYTDDEIEEIRELYQKTDKIFFEKAPETLEKMMESQKKDVDWTHDIEKIAQSDDMQKYMQENNTSLDEVNCKERLCKIVFSHGQLDNYKGFMNSRMDEGPWMTDSAGSIGSYKIDDSGNIKSFIYFTKKDDSEIFLDIRREMVKGLKS